MTAAESDARPFGEYSPGASRNDEQSLRELGVKILRRRLLLGSVFVVAFGAVAAYTFAATPRYKSEARVRIDPQQQSPTSSLTDQATSAIPGASLLGLGRDELETEIGVLRSDRIIDAMIDSLALGVRVVSPSGNRDAVLAAVVADPSGDVDGKLKLVRGAGGTYAVRKQGMDDVAAVPAQMIPNVPARIGGYILTLNPKLLTSGPQEIRITLLPRYQVQKLLDRRLSIARQEGGSRLVEVTYEDPDRALAARVVSRIVTEFVDYTNLTEETQDTTAVTQLRRQVDSTAHKLAAAETTLRAFEEQSRLIVPEEQATAQIKRIAAISTQVDAISAERNALERMLGIITQRSKGGTDPNAYRELATFPSLITNRAIQDLLQSLLDLENKRSALGVRRTEQNEEYKQLTDRITEIERQLYQLGPEYLESLDQHLASTARTVTALSDTLQEMPGAAMRYGQLVRNRTLSEATYLALQKQLKQAELRDVLRQQRVRVVDAPRVANREDVAFPRKTVLLLLGFVLGVLLALSAALTAELLRPVDNGMAR
jgi:uncharacterized protein involved in exopolysaccharide biosynthesis